MNEFLKQFSNQLAEDLRARFSSSEIKDFVAVTKASGDDRSFEVVMSTSDEDRQGDSLDQSRWDLKYYTMNPVVLWAHDYSSIPIGIVTDIETKGDETIATGKFAPAGINAKADEICALYQAKVVRAVSPGYIQNDDGTRELLEVSFCPVPAGRYALSLRQVSQLGMSTRDLVTKGFFYETKGAVPYKDHGTADADEAWDGPAEVKACGDDLDKLKSICAWFDSANEDKKSAYKLPHHRASDLKAVLKGVEAAGAAIQGSRGGVEIPEKDMAAVKAHLAKHYKEFDKTPPWEEKKAQDSPGIGDTCELEDGTPGTLADDPQNAGRLVCVPSKSKSQTMNDNLEKKFKAEHERHGKAVAKAIDEFKSIDEFTKSVDQEQEDHLANTMKAIDENYALEDQQPTKSVDEFKSAVTDEHLTHVKATDKAIEEFKGDLSEAGDDEEDHQKAIEEFTKAVGAELDRHENAHKALIKSEENEGDKSEEKALTDAILKAGRVISAKNKEKLKAIVKSIEDHHAEHEKFTNDVTAAIKELIGSGDGDGGEEPSETPEGEKPEGEEKALKSRSSTSGASAELEAYLLTQRLARQVKTAAEGSLRQINQRIKELYPAGR